MVNEDWLSDSWTSAAITTYLHRLRAAGSTLIAVYRFIPLQVQLSSLSVRSWFGIVRGLEVNVLMVTSFIYKCLANISPLRQVFYLFRSVPVPINDVSSDQGVSLRNAFLAYIRRVRETQPGVCQLLHPFNARHNNTATTVSASLDKSYHQHTLRNQYSSHHSCQDWSLFALIRTCPDRDTPYSITESCTSKLISHSFSTSQTSSPHLFTCRSTTVSVSSILILAIQHTSHTSQKTS